MNFLSYKRPGARTFVSVAIAVAGALLIFFFQFSGDRGRKADEGELPDKKSDAPGADTARSAVHPNVSVRPMDAGLIFPVTVNLHVLDADTKIGIRGAVLFSNRADRSGDPNKAQEFDNPIGATDAEGDCKVKITLPELLTVRAEGYAAVSLWFREMDELSRNYDLLLHAGLAIGGYIRDRDGNPISSARVSIEARNLLQGRQRAGGRELATPVHTALSDASGKWNCSEVDPGASVLVLRFVHSEFNECTYSTQGGGIPGGRDAPEIISREALEEGSAVFIMDYGLHVAGIITDQKGRPVPDARIGILRDGGARRPLPAGLSAADGRFRISNTKRGEVTLTVQANGFSPELRKIMIVPSMKEMEFRLQPGQSVSGRIISEDGTPVAGARIATAGLSDASPFPWEGNSDSHGQFLRDSAPLEAMSYFIQAEGYDSPSAPVVMRPGVAHEIVLHRLITASISGIVVDSVSRRPIDSYKVVALAPGDFVVASAAGENGRFVLSVNDRYSRYGVRIEADGYLPDESCSFNVRDGDRFVEIALKRGEGIRGIVVFPGGAPVPQADLFLFGASRPIETMTPAERMRVVPIISGTRSVRSAVGSSYSAYSTSDDGGVFSFAPMAGAHSVVATHEMGFAFTEVTFQEGFFKIILQPWGRIEGTLSFGRQSAGGQTIRLRTPLDAAVAPVYVTQLRAGTNEKGEFVFEKVPAGEYVITHVLPGGSTGASLQILTNAGETSIVRLGAKNGPIRPNASSHAIRSTTKQVIDNGCKAIDTDRSDQCRVPWEKL